MIVQVVFGEIGEHDLKITYVVHADHGLPDPPAGVGDPTRGHLDPGDIPTEPIVR
jgi:hypothetical protein